MFSSPVVLLGAALATFWAALFYLLFGRRITDLVLYWFVGLIGFAVGQTVADILGLRWLTVGQVHTLVATAACWAAMLVARCLKV